MSEKEILDKIEKSAAQEKFQRVLNRSRSKEN